MPEPTQAYLNLVGDEHRKRFGQFFTPPIIAEAMCRWVLATGISTLFDPAFGLGAFHRAAKTLRPNVKFSGMDIDETIIDYYRNISGVRDVHLTCADYLSSWGGQHCGIVCNPPYLRFHRFRNRSKVFLDFKQRLGVTLLGYTNIASAFLIKSVHELTKGGRLAYVMPLEFLNTGYGVEVKRFLLQSGCLRALIRIDCEREAFPDATTSVGIVLAAKDSVGLPVRFYNVSRLADLPSILDTPAVRQIDHDALDPTEKWLRFFDSCQRQPYLPSLVRLSYYGRFRRGIATGANDFFALSADTAVKLELPRSSLVHCITKSSQVRSPVLTDGDIERLERAGARVLLFDASGSRDQAVLRYLKYGEARGYHLRYLTRTRTPWYRLERRAPAPILFGVFSRNGYKVIRNFSRAVNLTCYHGFYPNCFGAELLDEIFLYLQSTAGRRILELSMRLYGADLVKFEPEDLNQSLVPSPTWFLSLSKRTITNAIEACRANRVLPPEMERVFDSLLVEVRVNGTGEGRFECCHGPCRGFGSDSDPGAAALSREEGVS